jgi:hypothetical protein
MAEWTDDGHFVPLSRFRKQCDAEFVIGERYRLTTIEERTAASHRSYFASVTEGWGNLRDSDAERFPTPDHLRKFALIKCGFADQRQIVCRSGAEAVKVAAFVAPMDTYAVIGRSGPVVTVWTAKSQSLRAMGKKEFADSQNAVREFIAGLISVTPDDLDRAASNAA